MVERLKTAIEKARAQRAGAPAPVSPTAGEDETVLRSSGPAQPDAATGTPAPEQLAAAALAENWGRLSELALDERRLERERVVTHDKSNPAHLAFDTLRTRLLRALREHGWWRVAITSPTKGCGKTMVAANLAFSLARQSEIRSMVFDLDLRAPRLGQVFPETRRRRGEEADGDDAGAAMPRDIGRFLDGLVAPEHFLRRIGGNLAIALNSVRSSNPAESMQSARTAAVLAGLWPVYQPHAAIFDMPPMLTCDDVMAFLPNIDAVLLVAAAGETRPDDIAECERLLADQTNFLGVMLNKSDEKRANSPEYDYYS